MKAIKKFLISLVCIIAFLGVVIISGYIFVRSKYGIDLFRTAGQLKTLTQEVDGTALCPNAFTLDDFAELKINLNNNLVDNFIVYNENSGYNGYSTDFSAMNNIIDISGYTNIQISEKQTGALGQLLFQEQTGGKINIGNKDLTVTIKQVDFNNINTNGNAKLNIVVQIDLTPLTDDMTSFPYSLFRKYIPNSLYVSSTVLIEKTDEQMGYTVTHDELKISNLTADDTSDLFHTLDAVLKIGSAQALNLSIGETVAQVLIGDNTNPGFAYSLRAIFNTYNFKTISNVDYFVIEK